MDKRFILIALVGLTLRGYGQKHYIKTDLMGYTVTSLAYEQVKPVQVNKWSIGYERALLNPHFTIGALFNYGAAPLSSYIFDPATGTTLAAYVYAGSYLFIESRCYRPMRKQDFFDLHNNKAHNGFFLGAYFGIMKLEEKNYNVVRNTYYLQSRYPIWIYGLGMTMGYKQMVLKHFFIEPLIGIAVGASSGYSNLSTRNELYSNLWRLEFNLGYSF